MHFRKHTFDYEEKKILKLIVAARWIDTCCEGNLLIMSDTKVRCEKCNQTQSFKKLSVYSGSHLELKQIWFAINVFISDSQITSARMIQKVCEISSYRSALNLLDRIRLACRNQKFPKTNMDDEFKKWLNKSPHFQQLDYDKFGHLLFAEFYTKKELLFKRDGSSNARLERLLKLSLCNQSLLTLLPRRK